MRRGPTSRLAWLAVASAMVVALTHLLRIFTPGGQRWDDGAYLEALQLPESVRDACDALLGTLRVPTIAIILLACLLIALVRRQPVTGFTVIVAFALAILSAEALAAVIPRPDLAADLTTLVDNAGANTFPSGHAAIATGLCLAVITVSAPRWRPVATGFGLAFSLVVACSTVIAGWHRPSDAVGGIALATAWMALAVALLAGQRAIAVQGRSPRGYLVLGVGIGVLLLAAVVTLATVAGGFLLAFATAQALVIVTASVGITVYALCLSDVDFSRHSR